MSLPFSSPGISQTPAKAAPALPFGPPAAAPTNRRNPFSATRLSEAGISQFDDIAKQEREGEDAFYRTQARQQSAAAQQQKLIQDANAEQEKQRQKLIQDANAEQEKQRQKALELDVTRASLQLAKAPETMTRTQREALEKKQLEEEAKVNRSAAATVAAAIRESPAYNERTDKSWLPFGMGKEPTPAAKELQDRAAAMDAPGYTPSASDLDQYRKINPTAFSELDSFKSTLESDKVASEQRTAAELAVARAKAIKDGLSPEEVDSLLGKPVASSAVEADTLDIDTRKASMARIESEVNSLATRESELTAEMQKGATSTRFDEIKQELATVSQQRTAKAAELTSQQKQVQDSAAALETKKKAQVEQSLSGQNPAILDTALKTAKVLADGSFETSQPEKIEALAKAGKKVFYSDGKQDTKPPTDAIRKEKKALTESKIKDISETAATLRAGSLKISENIQSRVDRGDITKEQGNAEWDSEIDAYSKQNEAKTAELGQYLGDALDDFKAGTIDAATLNAIYHAAGQPETGVEAFKEHKADLDAEDAHVEALSRVMLGADGSGKDDPTFNGQAMALTAQIEALSKDAEEKNQKYNDYDLDRNEAGLSEGEITSMEMDADQSNRELAVTQKKLADMRSEQRSKLKTELVRRGVPEDEHAGLIARAELSTPAPRVDAATAIKARGGGVKGAAGAVIEKLPYFGGFAEIARLTPYATLAAKLEKGETLSGEELDSLTEFVRYSGREGTTAMKIVEGVATFLSLSVEMAGATTGVGAGVTATRKAAAEAVKKGLTWAGTKKAYTMLAKAKAETLLKGGVTGGTVAKAIVAKTLKAIPQTAKFVAGTGANKTLAAYVDDKATQGIGVTEQEGKIVAALDRTGSLTGEARHSQGRMMVDAIFGQAKEFTTEKVGAAMPLLGKVLGRSAPKAAAAWQGLTAGAKAKISGLAMVRALQKLNPAKQTGDIGRFLRAAGQQGLGMEILEERIGDVADAAYGWFQDGKFDLKLPTAENFAVEVATMLIPMGAGAVQSVRAQNRIDKAITDSDAESSARIANLFAKPDDTAQMLSAESGQRFTADDVTELRNLAGPIEKSDAVRKSDERHIALLVKASQAEEAGDPQKAYTLKQMALEESRNKGDLAIDHLRKAANINTQIKDALRQADEIEAAPVVDAKGKKEAQAQALEVREAVDLARAVVKISRGLEAELTKAETTILKKEKAYDKGVISQTAIDKAAKLVPGVKSFVRPEQEFIQKQISASVGLVSPAQAGNVSPQVGGSSAAAASPSPSAAPAATPTGLSPAQAAKATPEQKARAAVPAAKVKPTPEPAPADFNEYEAQQIERANRDAALKALESNSQTAAIIVDGNGVTLQMGDRQSHPTQNTSLTATVTDGQLTADERKEAKRISQEGSLAETQEERAENRESLRALVRRVFERVHAEKPPAATAPANAPTNAPAGKVWRVMGSDTFVDIPHDMAKNADEAQKIAIGRRTDPQYRLPEDERPTEVQEIDESQPSGTTSAPSGTTLPPQTGTSVPQNGQKQPSGTSSTQPTGGAIDRKTFIAEKLNEALKNVGAAFTGITFNKSGERGAVERGAVDPESESVNFDLDAIDLQTLEITDPAALQLEIEKVVEEEVHHVETVKLLKRRAKKLGKNHDDLAAESWNDVTPELRKRVELLYNYGKSFPAGMPDSIKGYELYRFYTQMAKSGQITEGANFPESIKGLSKKAYNELVGFLRDLGTWMIEQLPKMPPAKRKQFKKDVAAVVKAVKALENYAKKSKPAKGATNGGLVSGSGASTGTTDAGASPPSSAAPADKAQTTIKASSQTDAERLLGPVSDVARSLMVDGWEFAQNDTRDGSFYLKKGGKFKHYNADGSPFDEAADVAPEKPASAPKSSTQFTLSPTDAAPILAFGESIPKAELFESVDPEWSNGALEDEPHVTVLYGLTKHEAAPVQKAIADHGPVTVTLGKMSLFESAQYDVLKIDVESKSLRELNAKLAKLPNENSFPDYKPHMTIAYLKKGEGKKYVGDARFDGREITFGTMTFSPPKELRGEIGKPELSLQKLPSSVLLKPTMMEVNVTNGVYEKDGATLRGYTVKYPNGLTKNVRLSQTAPVIGESPQTVKTEQSSATAEATAPAPKATDSKVAENGNSEDPKQEAKREALKKGFAGLFSSRRPVPEPSMEQVDIPKDNRMAIMEAAGVLVDNDVDTPEQLIRDLDDISPALRKYADAFWNVMRGFNSKLAKDPVWPDVFDVLDNDLRAMEKADLKAWAKAQKVETLPENPDAYFITEGALMMDISKLIPEKDPDTQPQSVNNALAFAKAASQGRMNKRGPIHVRDNGNGTYSVIDGNATYGMAARSDWNQLPVIVTELGDKLQFEAAFEARKAQFADKKAAFDDGTRKAAASLPDATPLIPPLKGARRSVEKMGQKRAEFLALANNPNATAEEREDALKKADINRLVDGMEDILRASIIVDTIDQRVGAIAALKEQFGEENVLLKEDRFAVPTPAGYSDIQLQVIVAPGMIAEMQIHIPEMLAAKEGDNVKEMGVPERYWPENMGIRGLDPKYPGHKYYEVQRNPETPQRRRGILFQIQQRLYGYAKEAYMARTGQSSAFPANSLNSSSETILLPTSSPVGAGLGDGVLSSLPGREDAPTTENGTPSSTTMGGSPEKNLEPGLNDSSLSTPEVTGEQQTNQDVWKTLEFAEAVAMKGAQVRDKRTGKSLGKLGNVRGGMEGEAKTAAQAVDAIQDGGTAKLSNEWRLKRSGVSGEQRIEIIGPRLEDHGLLTQAGVMLERIQWNMRYFVPTDGAAVLEKVLSNFNATVEEIGDGTLGASERPTSASDAEYMAAVEAGDMETAQAMVDAAAKAAGYDTIVFRAGDADEKGIKPWASFTPEKATAKAYLDNPGFGGAVLRAEYLSRVGDIYEMGRPSVKGFKNLAERIGLDPEAGQEWFDNGWQYPWEESSKVKRLIEESGIDAIQYKDDFPEGATTIVFTHGTQKATSQTQTEKSTAGGDRSTLQTRGEQGMAPSDSTVQNRQQDIQPTRGSLATQRLDSVSADPVTRDESGAVIPLSQRFNPESNSILYSATRPARLGIDDDVVADALNELDALPEADRERVNRIAGYDLITNEEQAAQAAAIKQEGTSQFYDETRDRENHKAWSKWANDAYNADPEGSIRKIVLEARNGFTGHSGQQAKLAMLVLEKLSRKAAFTGDAQMLRDVEAVTLAFDLRSTLAGREIAARWQPHATMEEQHRTTIAKAIFGPTGETRRKLDEAMSRASKNERIRELEAQVTKLLADLKARQAKPMKPAEKTTFVTDKKTLDKLRKDLERVKLAKTEAELLAEQNQTRLDEVREMFEESGFTMEEVMIDEAARLKLQSSPMVKKVLESFNPMERVAIRAIIEGKSDRAASVESKISRENIRKVEARFDEALNNELDSWIDRGFTPDDMDRPDFASFMDKKGKLFASIRPQPGGITMAQRQKLRQSWRNAIHPPARVRNNTARKRLKSKKGKGAGLRIRNPQHAITVMRVLQREDTSGFDRVYEYWINGILSGIGTHTANVAGNMANVMLEYGLQRWVEAGANMIIGDAKGATAGELITMSKWVAGAAVTAFKQAKEAWNYEVSSFDWDAMGTHPKLDSLSVDGKTGFIHRLAIAGTKGRIIRIPSRALLFMDEFTKYFVGTIEAAAQGHRIAKAEKLTGAAFDDRVNELVRIPGSPAWVLALEKAQEMTFQQDLPKMLADAQKLLNAKSKSKLGATVRFALKMIFPFIKTPYNILAAGLRKSPLGSVRLAGKAVTGGYKGKGAELSHDLAEQVIAAFVMMLVSGMAEGDPDDDKKPILITGTRGRDDRSEANFLNRSKGGETTVLFYGKPVFHYGRFAPLAVTVATIVNSLREMKKIPNGKDKIAVASSIFGDFVDTARSQTFLAGFDGLVNFVNSLSRESEGTEVQKAVKFLMNGAIPNIVRQTTRNLDEQVRDSKNAPWYYHAVPYGDLAEPLYDLYGRPAMKGGTALSRLFVTEPARVESVAPADVLLGRWNQLNPVQKEGDGSSYFPSDLTKASFKFKDLSGKYQDMTPAEIREFRKRVGVEISTQSAGLSTVPIQENIDELKKIRGSAAEKVKKEMFGGGVRPVLKSAPSLSQLLLGK